MSAKIYKNRNFCVFGTRTLSSVSPYLQTRQQLDHVGFSCPLSMERPSDCALGAGCTSGNGNTTPRPLDPSRPPHTPHTHPQHTPMPSNMNERTPSRSISPTRHTLPSSRGCFLTRTKPDQSGSCDVIMTATVAVVGVQPIRNLCVSSSTGLPDNSKSRWLCDSLVVMTAAGAAAAAAAAVAEAAEAGKVDGRESQEKQEGAQENTASSPPSCNSSAHECESKTHAQAPAAAAMTNAEFNTERPPSGTSHLGPWFTRAASAGLVPSPCQSAPASGSRLGTRPGCMRWRTAGLHRRG